jgi:hypothetical protein
MALFLFMKDQKQYFPQMSVKNKNLLKLDDKARLGYPKHYGNITRQTR